MAKKLFAKVERVRLSHTYKDAPYTTVKLELVLKAEDTMKGIIEVFRIEKKRFLFFKYEKKTSVACYGLKSLVDEIKRNTFRGDFSYQNNVSYWADIIELAWNKSIDRLQKKLLVNYEYEARIREAKQRELV